MKRTILRHLFTPSGSVHRLGNKSLTIRQADVLACHINHKAKDPARASILSVTGTIGEKGIESHLYHLSLKLDSKSTAIHTLAKYVKDVGDEKAFEDLYLSLLKEYKFSNFLQTIFQKFVKSSKRKCILIYNPDDLNVRPALELIQPWLLVAGVQSHLETIDPLHDLEGKAPTIIIYIFNTLSTCKDKEASRIKNNICYLNFSHNNYEFIIEILKVIFTAEEIKNAYTELIKATLKPHHPEDPIQDFDLRVCDKGGTSPSVDESSNPSHKNSQFYPVVSELRMPDKSVLLERPDLVHALDECFSFVQHGISIIMLIVLVGMGGSGKTTLARMWGRLYRQKNPKFSIWEINAETITSLSNSFRELAINLAQTHQQKKDLRYINQLPNEEEQETQRINFVKDCLKAQEGWLLIYDNVESYKIVKNYLPQNPDAWGNGGALITTRNSNLKDVETINPRNIFSIEKLRPEEVLELFLKIHLKNEPVQLSEIDRKAVSEFVMSLPPFPLDISIAARYITNSQLSYQDYLEQLNEQEEEFLKIQEEIINSTGEYSKTRYSLVSLAIQKIINIDKGFVDLFVCLSILESQNIPIKLLHECRGEEFASNFIQELKKQSLILENTKNKDSYEGQEVLTISLHRVVQKILTSIFLSNITAEGFSRQKFFCRLDFLTMKYFKIKTTFSTLHKIYYMIESYANTLLCNQSLDEIKLMIPHIKHILGSPLLKGQHIQHYANIILGCLCFHAGLSPTSESISRLENSLKTMVEDGVADDEHVAVAKTYLGAYYGRMGERERASFYFTKCAQKFNKIKNTKVRLLMLTYIGRYLIETNQYPLAQRYLEHGLKSIKQYENINGPIAQVYLGRVYMKQGKFQDALRYTLLAAEFFKSKRMSSSYAWALSYIGEIYFRMQDNTKALKVLKRSIDLYKKAGMCSHISASRIYTCIGQMMELSRRREEATKYFDLAIEVYKKNYQDLPERGKLYWNLYIERDYPQDALIYFLNRIVEN